MAVNRVNRSKGEVQKSYDRMSTVYDIMASSEKPLVEKGVEALQVKEGEHICELGCGTGHSLLLFSTLVGASGAVYGIDISEGMVHRAQKKIGDAPLQNIEVIQADAAHLPFRSSVFHALFMSFTLELFDTPHIPQVLQECSRVLLPGGRMCVVGLSKKNAGIAVTIYEWIHRLIPRYVDCRPIFIEGFLQDEGFKSIDSQVMTMWGLPVEIVTVQNP
jgi:demethylmenaquinone methyltransferase/2-methoxy-6-polyprenyl-1,4-benzoquinol methylase